MFEGRASELERIEQLLDTARAARGAGLVLHGEPGIGKTALLARAADRAEDFELARTSGYEARATLPFAALRHLVEPFLELLPRLPPVQAQALGGALGLESPSPHARVAVPISLLGLLGMASAERPLLALVDDVHWLDPASREAILFVARRLGTTRIALLLATRSADGPALERSGVDRLAVGPLDRCSARALLSRSGRSLAEPVREAVIDAADGNPLALVELPVGLTVEQRVGRVPLDVPLRPGPLVEASFIRRVARLEAPARHAVTVAAAMERGPLRWLLAALAELGVAEAALDAPERAGILVVQDGQVALQHSLLRAAVYHAADEPERRAAHHALAATAPDPPLRAWHLAVAATEADAGIAGTLEYAARHARAVGGHVEAAEAFARAAALSVDDHDRGLRELEAARDLAVAGDLERALAMLGAAEGHAPESARAEIAGLRGNLAIRQGNPDGAYRTLVTEAERCLAADDHAGAAGLFLEASVAPMITGNLAQEMHVVSRARDAARTIGGPPAVLADLLAGETLVMDGRDAEGDAALEAVARRLPEIDLLDHGEIVGMAAQTSIWVGSFDRGEAIIAAVLEACRDVRALGRLPYPLSVRAQLGFRRGDWADAARDVEEAVSLARDSGQETMLAFALANQARLDAAQGRTTLARERVEEARQITDREQASGVAVHVHAAGALVELVAGAFDAAIEAAIEARELERRLGLRQLAAGTWVGELVEALVAAGRPDEARAAVHELVARAFESGSIWAAMIAGRGAVLLADDDEIDARSVAARAAHARLDLPFERARTELAIGERLRRAQRRSDARLPLNRALAAFERLAATPFVERSRVGLAAPAPPPDVLPSPLSAAERRIVALVVEGRTNREIAAELQLGQKTLERRLTALYRKLGVASRTELARDVRG